MHILTAIGRAPTYVIGPGTITGKNGSLTKNGAELRRNSTIYSKPTWPNEGGQVDTYKDHHCATIAGEQEEKCDSGTYSYAYQHNLHLPEQSLKKTGERKGDVAYQEMGTVDYMHMYSKPSPLLLSSERSASPPRSVEKGYTHLSSATLDAASVYTNTVQRPTNLE